MAVNSQRIGLADFALANPLYANARVSVLEVSTTTRQATTTLAPLYRSPVGTATHSNPVSLDGEGKWLAPVYVDREVICRVAGAGVPSHDTGISGSRSSAVLGDWTAGTVYISGDVVRDGDAGNDTGNLYIATTYHTASASFATDLAAEQWAILVDMDQLAREAAVASASVYIGTLALTQPPANAVYQRDSRTGGLWSKGLGSVPLTINPSQPLTLLEYRLRDYASPGVVLQDWITATAPLHSGSQEIRLPSVPAGLYRYLIDLRVNTDATSIVSTTNPVMVGEVRAFAGQSLFEDLITTVANGDTTTIAASGLTISDWGWIFASYGTNTGAVPQVPDYDTQLYPPTAWQKPSDAGPYDSTFAVELMNRLIGLAGVPVGLIGYAVGGTGIASWLPDYGDDAGEDGTPHYEPLAAVITLAGGKFGGFWWCQGHYESRNGNTEAAYLAQIELLFDSLRADFPLAAGFFELICTIPGIGAYSTSTITTRNMVRETALAYVAANPTLRAYVDGLDATLMPDLVHPSQAGNILFAQQWFRADAKKMALLAVGSRGPVMTGVTRAYTSQVFKITCTNPNGGSAWVSVGSPLNQFTIYPTGTLTGALTLSALDLTHWPDIWITTSSSITEPAAFDVWYRPSPDDATIIAAGLYDNVTDGDGITVGRQLALLGTPLVCQVPVVELTLGTISDDDAGTSTVISGTYTNGLPVGLDYSLDGGATWTSAASPTIGSGAYSFTLASGFPVGVYVMKIRDSLTYGEVTSNQFSITMASPPALPSISSPIFGLDMSAPLAHVFTDTNQSIQAVAGDAVGSVSDLSGSSSWFRQTTVSARPVFQTNVKNGLPGLLFTGTLSQFLSVRSGASLAGLLKASTGYGILIVYTPTDLTANMTLFAASEKAKIGGFNLIRGNQILTTAVARSSRNSDAAFYQPSVSSAATANLISKSLSRYDGGANTLKMKINALTEAGVTSATLGTNAFTVLYIGAEGSNNVDQFFFTGYIHEIRVWNSVVSDANRDALMTYAADKWSA